MLRKNKVLKIQIIIIVSLFLIVGLVIAGFAVAYHIEHTSNKEEATECFKTFVEQVKADDYVGILSTVKDAESAGLTIQDIEVYINDSGLANLKNVDWEKELYAVDEGTSNWYGWVFYDNVTYKVYFDETDEGWKLLLPELTEK